MPEGAPPLDTPPGGVFARAIKRSIDVAGAAAGLWLTAPVLLGVGAAIRLSMGAPVFYRQVRPGQGARAFRVWKFRTMSNARGAQGALLSDGERLTAVGRFLRERSLDELPQLFNVLRGDMSLVGPRPLLMRYLPRYSHRQLLRQRAKPGITGWAQINGRNGLGWDERLEMDVWYVENWSLRLDLRILLRTFTKLVDRSDVFAGAGAELEEFWGAAGSPEGVRALPVEEDER